MKIQHLTEEQFASLTKRVRSSTDARRTTPRGSSREAAIQQTKSRRGESASSPLFASFVIAITGQLISGKNRVRIRRDGHHYPEKQFINWRAKANLELNEQLPKAPNIAVPIRLTCDYWPGDHRTRDVSGQLDALFYLLVYASVITNDGLIYEVVWRRHALYRFPKVVMEIEAYVAT